ncbi:hypothetical protein [Mycobacterium sp. 852002-51961_SCH5331710]|uniref:hypothetical protein n=1 Tax=Mycobacterium sp. 852002-51961_SCH5331710 TaxID=1834105 RepID=UPI000AAE3215|nr:hypothetical protein [Mycobacterium sp. 852002-51961_SCH5331710]
MTALRRLLSRRISVEAMLELGMWLAIPYLLIGLVWAFFDAEQVQLIDTAFRTRIPAGSDIGAFMATALFWPANLVGFELCVP